MNYAEYKRYWNESVSRVGARNACGWWKGNDPDDILPRVLKQAYVDDDECFAYDGYRVYDVGCGNGIFYPYLCKRLPHLEYVGVDVAGAMVKEARQTHPDAQFVTIDRPWLPYRAADLIAIHQVFMHIAEMDAREWLQLARERVNNGLLSVSIYYNWVEAGCNGNVIRVDYNPDYFLSMLHDAGWIYYDHFDGPLRQDEYGPLAQRWYLCKAIQQ